MMARFNLCFIALGLTLASCAGAGNAPDSPSARTCFRPDDVQNFKYESRNVMVVETHRKETYALYLMGVCPDLDSATAIGFKDVTGPLVCNNTRASIAYNGLSFGQQSCRIVDVEKREAPTTH